MRDKGHEIHARPALDPLASIDGNRHERDARSNHRRGIVAPQIRGHQKLSEVRGGNHAEIADAHGKSRQHAMKQPVQRIRQVEQSRFGPLLTGRKHRRTPAMLLEHVQ